MKIGRRPVYIIGTFLNLVGCIIGGFQQTVEVYYVVNILTGFGAAPVDSLVQISTTDIFFAHERGTRLSCFALALRAGSYMGPFTAGYITESQGWQYCFWYLVILFGILLCVQILSLEESVYRRPMPEPGIQCGSMELGSQGLCDDKQGSITDVQPITRANRATTLESTTTPPQMSYWRRLAPMKTKQANPKPWWFLCLLPFRLFLFPAVVWAGVMTGIQIMWLSLLSVTQSELFSAPPYNFGIAAGKLAAKFCLQRHHVPPLP